MKLRYSTTSPYVRKVTMTALESGLDDRIERVPANPWDPEDALPTVNPIGKVPALETDEGEALHDSVVICEYLDSLQEGAKLFPVAGPDRWRALRIHALADGILDAAILKLVETRRRPDELRWSDWVARQDQKISRALDRLEADVTLLEGPPTIGSISVAIALDYLDFRFPEFGWREGRSNLTHWYEAFSERPSFQETRPREP